MNQTRCGPGTAAIRSAARCVPAIVAALALAACADDASTSITVPTPAPNVVDAAHGGTPGFFFLPPLVANPTSMEAADMSVAPVVEICALANGVCGGNPLTFTTTTGIGGEVVRSDGETGFIVNWRTDQVAIPGATLYRIRVLLGGIEQGHADVQLVSDGQSMRDADTDAPIALTDGRTLPIRFRITRPVAPPPTLSARDEREPMASGSTHSCALDAAGQAWCWGSNFFGELGTGSTGAPTAVPQAVIGGHAFTSIVAGAGSTCALDVAGAGWCWGANSDGQLGRGTKSSAEPAPQQVTGAHIFAALSATSFHVCGRTAAGEIWCWGYGLAGALGNGAALTSATPVKASVPGDPMFARVAAGGGHTCGLTDAGQAWCWGSNEHGQLGRATVTAIEPSPAIAAGGQTFAALTLGGQFTCALDALGVTRCWGSNTRGQLGRGAFTETEEIAAPVEGAPPFVRIVAGLQFACGQTVTGAAFCWGANEFGQLGTGAVGPAPDNALATPQPVLEGARWPVLAPGFFHTCGIAFDGSARCWGNNTSLQVGVASPSIVPAHTTVGAQPFALP